MLKFITKEEEPISSITIPKTINVVEEQLRVQETIVEDNVRLSSSSKYMKVDFSALPIDPGERPPLEHYHVSQRDEIRRAYLRKGPCQPRNHSFQQRVIGGRLRRFNPAWFNDYKYWLEYSIKKEAAFCLCCYLFKSDIKNPGGTYSFVKDGFKTWNKRERLDLHNDGSPHNLAVQKCKSLMNQSQSINNFFDKDIDLHNREGQVRLNASIDCVRFLLRQGLPFGSHDENEDLVNTGNFLELLQFYVYRNERVDHVMLKNDQKKLDMKCCSIQKGIVHVAAKEIVKVIMQELRDDFFGIIVDESCDTSCKEQVALVLRYVNHEGIVVERFVGIKHVSDTSALSVKSAIYSILFECGLSPSKIRGQGYNGASNMRDAFNGLKTLIMNDERSAHYVHCFSHQLESALVFVAKNNLSINDFFEWISRLLKLIEFSYKLRDKLREKQATNVVAALAESNLETDGGLNKEAGIKQPDDTYWGSHYGSLLNIMTMYPSICEVLEDIEDDSTCQDQRAEVCRLLESLETFDFVFCLHLMVAILGITNELNSTLQKKDQNLLNAMHLVRVSKHRLQELKDGGWTPLLQKVASFCNEYNIEFLNMEDSYAYRRSCRKDSQVSNLNHYQVDLFYSVIDMQLQELNNRFNEANTTLLVSVADFCPSKSFQEFDEDHLIKMAEYYPSEFSKVELEALREQIRNYIVDVRGDARFNHLKGMEDLSIKMVETRKHKIYPMVYLILKLALILPVAASTVERSYSAMKFVKNELSNNLGDQFMNDRLVSCIEKDVLDGISNATLLEYF